MWFLSVEISGSVIWWFCQGIAHSDSLHQWPQEILWEGQVLIFLMQVWKNSI